MRGYKQFNRSKGGLNNPTITNSYAEVMRKIIDIAQMHGEIKVFSKEEIAEYMRKRY